MRPHLTEHLDALNNTADRWLGFDRGDMGRVCGGCKGRDGDCHCDLIAELEAHPAIDGLEPDVTDPVEPDLPAPDLGYLDDIPF